MMKRLWLLSALLSATAAMSSAQVAEFAVSGGVHRLNGEELAQGFSLDDGWRLAFRLTINNWNFFGQEFGYAYNRAQLQLNQGGLISEDGMAIHQGFWNFLVYATPEGSRIRPFATGGGHFSNFVPPGASATYGQGSTKFGVNYGGGVKARIGEKWHVRFDLRQYLTGKPFGDSLPVEGKLRMNEISVGFGIVL
jgi:opacity protein-like surface antigen